MTSPWHHPSGSTGFGPWSVWIEAGTSPGWEHTSLRVADLPAAGAVTVATGVEEMLLVPLAGSVRATVDGTQFAVAGRDSVLSLIHI